MVSNLNKSNIKHVHPTDKVLVHTDGSCVHGNKYGDSMFGRGGWAAVITENNITSILSGATKWTTVNQMELLAVIKALEFITYEPSLKTKEVLIFSHSTYVVNLINKYLNSPPKQNDGFANYNLRARLYSLLNSNLLLSLIDIRKDSCDLINQADYAAKYKSSRQKDIRLRSIIADSIYNK